MTGRMLRLSPILLVAALAACGGETKTETVTRPVTVTVTVTETRPQETTALRVYLLRDGKVGAVAREVPKTQAVAQAALEALLGGPTEEERQLGLETGISQDAKLENVSVRKGVASFAVRGVYSRAGLAQIVYTLTQFATVKAVASGQQRLTRADFEEQTPAILVESPLPFQEVAAPLRVTGTANTFEATFEYELTDPTGKVLSKDFVTATSGSGERGTFEFTVPFEAPMDLGELIVFERSAADGSRTHQVEIPLRLRR